MISEEDNDDEVDDDYDNLVSWTGDRQKSAKFKKPEKSSFLHSCSSRLNVKIIQPLNGPLLDLVSGNE